MVSLRALPVLLLLTAQLVQSNWQEQDSPYSIIIDGGSTGSRLHVFEFVEDEGLLVLLSRGSSRANVPLSAFANERDPKAVAEHLLPSFEYAATIVPAAYHSSTFVTYQATAGMRLLSPKQQEQVYDALYQGLVESPTFKFSSLRREDIQTLSGELEGLYGAVAANYLNGTINANMEYTGDSSNGGHVSETRPIGALDMGGASTQIVYVPRRGEDNLRTNNDDDQTCLNEQPRLNGSDFFSTSYLSYGVDQFRERLWNTWVNERASVCLQDQCLRPIIENPCAFKGYKTQYKGMLLVGTGDSKECINQVQRLIPHPEETDHDVEGNKVGGVAHPPVTGKFFAMSLFYFTLDSLRELSNMNAEAHRVLNLSWPNPSIQELADALEGLCSREWVDLEKIQHHAHAYTRPAVLPHRCFESVYLVTLLKDGFGFASESRDITFAYTVDGSEVEWSLGLALALRGEKEAKPQQKNVTNSMPASSSFKNNLFQRMVDLVVTTFSS
jgi:hypothetical protein